MDELPKGWDPMKEDANSLTNCYQYDSSDINSLLFGYKGPNWDEICQHYLKGHCKYGVGCVHKHLTAAQVEELDAEETLVELYQTEQVKEGTSLTVTVTCCKSPFSFYVTPAEDLPRPASHDYRVRTGIDFIEPTKKNYVNMAEEMTAFYRKPENRENLLILPAIASLVAVKGDPLFYRARVLDMTPDENGISVMNMDSGIETTVERRFVFALKPQFAILPAYAIHCGLEISTGVLITDQVKNNFKKMVVGQMLQAKFNKRDIHGRFKVDLFYPNGRKVSLA